jgi:aspartyl-tRNA(Asn)/glutamyl-tRNA(Gln) amidotransferase subunit A
VDILLTPTMPCLPPRADATSSDSSWLAWCPFTPFFNLSHGPALSVPWPGSGPGAFPIGLQVGSAPGRDGAAIAAASMIEALAAARSRQPDRSVGSTDVARRPADTNVS